MAVPGFSPVTVGALVAVPISGAFIYLEIGRYATPQVPRTLFNERKELFAYTAGLFVGILLAFLFLLLTLSLRYGGIYGTVISLAALLALLEGAQLLLGRSVYFGSDGSLPFYSLGYRAGAAAVLGLASVAAVLAGPSPAWDAFGASALLALAFLLLLVAGGIQSTATGRPDARKPGSIGRAAVLEGVGFLLLGIGPLGGPVGVLAASLAIAGGSAGIYWQRRDEVLGRVRPPPVEGEEEAERPSGRFARKER